MTPIYDPILGALRSSDGASGSGPYLLRDEPFTAEPFSAYAVDTSAVNVVPAVMPTATIGGLRFTGTSVSQSTDIGISSDALYFSDEDSAVLAFCIEEGVTTLQDVVDLLQAEGLGITLASIAPGFSGTDLAIIGSGTLSGGSPATSEPIPVSVTLPASPTAGQYIDLADARGTWGSNPLTVLRNGHKIEGVTADFINNASGTFFRLLYVDSTIGWRVLASGTKPLNLTAPTITGSPYVGATLTAGDGTWTGSPTSFSYQWQSSADAGETWSDIGGATSQTCALTSGEDGKIVRVQVIATNANGPSVAVASLPTEEITVPAFPMGGLLAFWKLADLTDSSGNGNTLTNNNDVTFGAGKIGNAMETSGTQWLSSPISVPLSGDFTISAWVYANASQPDLFPTPIFTESNACSLLLTEDTGFYPSPAYIPGLSLRDEWFFVAFGRSGSSAFISVNAGAAASASFTSTTPEPLCLGSNTFGGGNNKFSGKIDGVGIWDRALTNEEIAMLYNDGTGAEPA